MTHAYAFEHDGKTYSVTGYFAVSGNEEFSVARRLHKSELRASIDAQAGAKLEGVVVAASEAELVGKLKALYPGLEHFIKL